MDIKKLKQNAPVFILWSLLYWGYLNWFFKRNWQFHIFSSEDWKFFVKQWNEGWVVQGPDQWIFILVAVAAIPVWYIVLKLLLPLPYRKWYEDIFFDRIYKRKMDELHDTEQASIERRPSYRKVRPKELPHGIAKPADKDRETTATPAIHPQSAAAQSAPIMTTQQKLSVPVPVAADPFNLKDSLYTDEAHTETISVPSPTVPFENMETEIQPLREDIVKVMEKACVVFPKASIKGEDVSFVAVGKNTVYLCQVDDAEGDWLADEDPFGNEAPLWFSDKSHRVSPIFNLLKLQADVESLLKKKQIDAACQSVFVKTQGVIINAEEMLPVWRRLGVIACRSQDGGAAALPSFTESFPKETAPTQAFVKKVKEALSLSVKKASASKAEKTEKKPAKPKKKKKA